MGKQMMLSYIKEQPKVWSDMVNNREELFGNLAEKFTAPRKRIIFIGTGSSLTACKHGEYFFREALGIEANVVVPTRLGATPDFLNPEETLVFAASQTGRSTSTLQAIEIFREKGFPVIAVTAIDNTPIVRASDCYQPIVCGEEISGPKTKGMTATALTLFLAGIALASKWGKLSSEKENEIIGGFNKAFSCAPDNIAVCCDFFAAHRSVLAAQPHFILISDGMGFHTAEEGALKMLETLCVPVMAYEFEEYLHGVNNTIEPGMCNVLAPTLPENFERVERLDNYCRQNGCIDYIITTADWVKGENVLKLKGTGSRFTSLFEIMLAFQILSVYSCEYKGIDCDDPKGPEFYKIMDTKAQDAGDTEWRG